MITHSRTLSALKGVVVSVRKAEGRETRRSKGKKCGAGDKTRTKLKREAIDPDSGSAPWLTEAKRHRPPECIPRFKRTYCKTGSENHSPKRNRRQKKEKKKEEKKNRGGLHTCSIHFHPINSSPTNPQTQSTPSQTSPSPRLSKFPSPSSQSH